ncbi:acyltransferase [Opitutus sp. GAS368]|jgi:peptidoglycan/LPS O-acetylase OafA/YrhL|uniref:acyltransferase family protein n=1 Tax=Opitutus sp. GAS368 TaxID=1882749 RepID=UPI00087DCBE2|nr:acyltransferase [Opitutus sp. GAS368]SDS63965.1 Peptidoglycan/LPS O-acetylase OafA/YrhL, contains acyltransferase and SGNH-hydrolase domains [Opitutus sp. GAS368]
MTAARPLNAELEGVRGLACLMVACSHVFYVTHLDPTVTLPGWLHHLEAGQTGVLVFFVLSGYLISWTNPGDCTAENRRAYLWRRFVRLGPIYYAALALTFAVLFWRRDPAPPSMVIALLAGAHNFNDYFGLHVPPPMVNGPLWSLNYEILYYGLFILLWRFSPRLGWVFLPAAVATVLGWFTPQWMPLFLASYACGWLYWAAGWWLARLPELPATAPAPAAVTWLLLVFAGHQIGGMVRVLNALGLHSQDAGMVTLGQLGGLPAILLLLAAVTRRRLPGAVWLAALAWISCVVPLAGMLWTGRLWSEPGWINGGIAVLLAVAALPIRSTGWLKSLAGLGRISYAFYVVHFPMLFLVLLLPLPGGTLPAYLGRVLVWAVTSLALACFLELRLQPWAKARLSPPRSALT